MPALVGGFGNGKYIGYLNKNNFYNIINYLKSNLSNFNFNNFLK